MTTRPADDEPALHLPLLDAAEDAVVHSALEEKPSWRGWIHAITFPVALVAGLVLIMLTPTLPGRVGAAVFTLSSLLLFGISATYHRFRWAERMRVALKRLDHANIFLLIAGTYTPLAILCLPTEQCILLLSIVWGGALIGILFRIFWLGAPRWLYVPLYLALGWAAVAYLPAFWLVSPAATILVILGGLAYSAGAVIYGMKRPNPVPGHFGFHEIFHALTVIAFLCHWAAVLLVAIAPSA